MRTSEVLSLPRPGATYDGEREAQTIRSIEQYLQDLRTDIIENRDGINKPASLALRRHQFLLMGA